MPEEEARSWEELARDEARGSMPEEMRPGDEKPGTQYSMDDVRKLDVITQGEPAITTPEPTDQNYEELKQIIFERLNALRDSTDACRITSLARVLRDNKPAITEDNFPHIMREVRIALKFNAERFFLEMRNKNIRLIAEGNNLSAHLLGYLYDDLSFMKKNGIEVKPVVQDVLDAVHQNMQGAKSLIGQGDVTDKLRQLLH